MSIQQAYKKIKALSLEKRLILEYSLIALIALCTGASGFILGKYTFVKSSPEPIQIGYEHVEFLPAQAFIAKEDTVNLKEVTPGGDSDGVVVASKNGTKYHFPWCSGALRMQENNKVYFNSIEEARSAGYLPASNCSGLE